MELLILVQNKKNSSTSSWATDVQGVSRGGDHGRPGEGTATMSNEMFNLVKGVLGVGVLSLPAGQ